MAFSSVSVCVCEREREKEREKSLSAYKDTCNGIKCALLVTQLCPILCEPMNCSPPGSSVHGVLQSRILEWATIPLSTK